MCVRVFVLMSPEGNQMCLSFCSTESAIITLGMRDRHTVTMHFTVLELHFSLDVYRSLIF